MKKILLIISCVIIVLVTDGAAQETEKRPDKDIQQLVEKPFF